MRATSILRWRPAEARSGYMGGAKRLRPGDEARIDAYARFSPRRVIVVCHWTYWRGSNAANGKGREANTRKAGAMSRFVSSRPGLFVSFM